MRTKMETAGIKSAEYPNLLKNIPDPPSKLYVLGRLPSKEELAVSIVGTRRATPEGRRIACELAQKISRLGIIIVSGLALGIDTSAHLGALAGKGKTVAVLGSGLGRIYPAQNCGLAERIIQAGGAIVSEYPIEEPPHPGNFLRRNRIISGLSIATIVIEAPKRSGALATARLAAEQGREVFVLTGPADHPNYQGSHQLIRDGARLVSSIKDILEDLEYNH